MIVRNGEAGRMSPMVEPSDHKVAYGSARFLLRYVGMMSMKHEGNLITCRRWQGGGLAVLVSVDITQHGKLLHMSISHKHRYPTWDEIAGVRYALISGDIDMAMLLPQESDFISIHPNCFHLWQTPTEWGVQ